MSNQKFNLPETIHGKRVTLIKRNHHYDDQIWKAINNNREFLKQYLGWVDYVKTLDHVIISTEEFLRSWENNEKNAYIIADSSTKELLGCIDLHDIHLKNQIAAIGYWIREDKTGNGLVSEAVGLLENETFKNQIHRLEIRCDEDNRASANVALRCNYSYEATLKENMVMNDSYRNQEIYVKFNPNH